MIIEHHFNSNETIMLMKVDAYLMILQPLIKCPGNKTDLMKVLNDFRIFSGLK